jgi:Mycothiol maleylpyruvate isomerase N-terminal domain
MSGDLDEAILAELQRSSNELARLATGLGPRGTALTSYCSHWTVARVYSHLGSGAEIGRAALLAAKTGAQVPDPRQTGRCGMR